MEIYNYNAETKEFTGQGLADPSPLEPGVWLIPANATTVMPPAPQPGKVRCFDGARWVYADLPEEPQDPGYVPPEPTPEEVLAELTAAVQRHLDDTARTRNYDGILSLCTYAQDPDPKFAAEGMAGVAWRSAVWRTCYSVMDEVLAGTRGIPTAEELIALLPPFAWPGEE